MSYPKWHLPADRYFDPDPTQRRVARELYESDPGDERARKLYQFILARRYSR